MFPIEKFYHKEYKLYPPTPQGIYVISRDKTLLYCQKIRYSYLPTKTQRPWIES